MNGEAERTPTDPGVNIEQNAIDEIARGLSDALRSVRAVSRRLREARPAERPIVVAGAYDASRDLVAAVERQTYLLGRLASADAPTLKDMAAMGNDITPDTHIRMSTAKFVALIVALIGLVTGGVTGWVTLTSSLAVHVNNSDVHLDPGYQKDHGRPVGKWDIESYKAEVGRRLDSHDEKLDRILNLLVNKADAPKRRTPQ